GGWARGFGLALLQTALDFETKATLEAYILDGFEAIARSPMQPIKAALRDAGLPAPQAYARAQVPTTPKRAEDAAFAVGADHLAEGSLFPGLTKNTSSPPLEMPVVEESSQLNQIENSQLVRSSVPWIHRWRLTFLDFAEEGLLLSR